MIVPMQKVTILAGTAWQEELLAGIRDLGVVHITPLDPQNSTLNNDTLDEVKANSTLLEEALGLMPDSAADPACADGLACAKEVLAIHKRQKILKKEIGDLEDQHLELQVWGRFSPDQLATIQGNLPLHFFLVAPQELNRIPPETCVYTIGHKGNRLLIVTIGLDGLLDGFQEVTPPPRGLTEIENILA